MSHSPTSNIESETEGEACRRSDEEGDYEIEVRGPFSSTSFTIQASGEDTLANVKGQIQYKTGAAVQDFYVTYNGREIRNDRTKLRDYHLSFDSRFNCHLRARTHRKKAKREAKEKSERRIRFRRKSDKIYRKVRKEQQGESSSSSVESSVEEERKRLNTKRGMLAKLYMKFEEEKKNWWRVAKQRTDAGAVAAVIQGKVEEALVGKEACREMDEDIEHGFPKLF
jgi:hypothetical protein